MVKPAKNTLCLWYDGDAEEAARFYARTFPDSSVGAVHLAPGDFPTRAPRKREGEHDGQTRTRLAREPAGFDRGEDTFVRVLTRFRTEERPNGDHRFPSPRL
jgi:3-demethylubiquinone-9 3-methyltransferase